MVVVFGTVCLDRIRQVPAIPAPGGYVEIESERELLGGEAANTALCLKAWGVPYALFANPIGDDPEGERLVRLIGEKGLPAERFQKTAPRTPVCDVYVTPDGERTMIGRGFSDMGQVVSLDGLPLEPGAWFTAEPNFGPAARAAARMAIGADMKTYLMDFLRDDDPIAEGSFWQTSTDWAGFKGDAQATLDWAKSWSGKFGCHTLVTDGALGLVYSNPSSRGAVLNAFPCPLTLDSTGAGDAFRAGMLHGLVNRHPLHECLAFASAAGCLTCGYLGATSSTPRLDEIEDLMMSNQPILDAIAESVGLCS